MSNWLEEAESKKKREEEAASITKRIEQKKDAVRQNYEANKDLYEGFIQQLKELSGRVNDLPMEYRDSFGKINFRVKESKLNNHLYYLTSSKRVKKRLHKSFFTFFKKYSFKHIRVGYFTISREMGMMDVELKENLLIRVRMKSNGGDKKTSSRRKKNDHRKDFVFRCDIKKMNENSAMEIIDWLAFRKPMEQISFFDKKCHSFSS